MTLWVPAMVVPEFISSATLVNILLVSQSPSSPLEFHVLFEMFVSVPCVSLSLKSP